MNEPADKELRPGDGPKPRQETARPPGADQLREELSAAEARYWGNPEQPVQIRDLQYIQAYQLKRDIAGERHLRERITSEATDIRQFIGWVMASWGLFALLLGVAIMSSKTGCRGKK